MDFYLSGTEFFLILLSDVGDAVMTLCSMMVIKMNSRSQFKCVGDLGKK